MILFRYFARQVFVTTFAVAGIVLIISVGWRFTGYLEQAAAGAMTSEVLFALMAYRLPGFLELILPLGFFLAIMLVYGGMHVGNEMVVMHACGISPARIIGVTLTLSLGAMLFTAAISLWLKPLGERQVEVLLAGQQNLTEFDTLIPGRFQTTGKGRRVAYTEDISGKGNLAGVFINDYRNDSGKSGPKDAVTVIAETGTTEVDATGRRLLILHNGTRYRGVPGQKDYQVAEYEEYGQVVEKDMTGHRRRRQAAIATPELFSSSEIDAVSELHWRISMVFIIPVLALIAIPLSRVNPRQGRFTRLIPGMLFCFLYVVSLSGARSWLERGYLPLEYGLWWVHGIFITITAAVSWLDRRFDGIGELVGQALAGMFRTRH